MEDAAATVVIVVDGDAPGRSALVQALRRLGVRALGVAEVADAAALLDALDADVTVVRDAENASLEPLREREARVVALPGGAALDEAVVAVLRELGRPDEAALIN